VTQHVLFIVTNAAVLGPKNRKTGFFFAEVAHPFDVLDKAGIAVEFASRPADGRPTMPMTKKMLPRRSSSRARRSGG
jgi:putative intracellular protease/amidase